MDRFPFRYKRKADRAARNGVLGFCRNYANEVAGAGITAEEIDLVIVATNTPDMRFSATACLVQDRTGQKPAPLIWLPVVPGLCTLCLVGSQFVSAGSCGMSW